jgi:hypothetical protein
VQTRRLAILLALLALAACAPSPAPDPRLARLVNELRVEAAFHAEATELAWLCRPDSRAGARGLNTEGRRVAACERLLDLLTGQDPPPA